jgi:hypothetical protein
MGAASRCPNANLARSYLRQLPYNQGICRITNPARLPRQREYSSRSDFHRVKDVRIKTHELPNVRQLSWAARLNLLSRVRDPLDGMSEGEEAVRTAILEKVLKGGRQPPADLMLRCEPEIIYRSLCCER